MSTQHIPIDNITEADLSRLVEERISESKTLEFKEAIEVATDFQKQEFLSDVTALANSDGGDILLGIRATDGIATALIGLRKCVPDSLINQLENLLRDSVQPRLAGVGMIAVTLSNGNPVLVLRIPRSWTAPHMVRHGGVTRFCGRNSGGKYDLDVHQVRAAFLASEGIADRLKNFRLERVNRLISGTVPVVDRKSVV